MNYITYNDLLQPSKLSIKPKSLDIDVNDVRNHPSRKMPDSAYWNYTHDLPQPAYTPEGNPRADRSMAAEESMHWSNQMRNDEVNTN